MNAMLTLRRRIRGTAVLAKVHQDNSFDRELDRGAAPNEPLVPKLPRSIDP